MGLAQPSGYNEGEEEDEYIYKKREKKMKRNRRVKRSCSLTGSLNLDALLNNVMNPTWRSMIG